MRILEIIDEKLQSYLRTLLDYNSRSIVRSPEEIEQLLGTDEQPGTLDHFAQWLQTGEAPGMPTSPRGKVVLKAFRTFLNLAGEGTIELARERARQNLLDELVEIERIEKAQPVERNNLPTIL